MKNISYKILFFSGLFIFTSVFIAFTLYSNSNNFTSNKGCGVSGIDLFCGTKSYSIQAQTGKKLFNINCAACHMIDKIMTGPALGGVTKRRDKKWLYSYVRNSIQMYKKGDSIAISLRNQGYGLMTSFPNLTDEEIDAIFKYIEEVHNQNN